MSVYFRRAGKVMGPFSEDKARGLLVTPQWERADVSLDKIKWVKASEWLTPPPAILPPPPPPLTQSVGEAPIPLLNGVQQGASPAPAEGIAQQAHPPPSPASRSIKLKKDLPDSPPAEAGAGSTTNWFVLVKGNSEGPFPESDLIQKAVDGLLNPVDLVWKEGSPGGWVRADSVELLRQGKLLAACGSVRGGWSCHMVWRRLGAFAIDYFVLFILVAAAVYITRTVLVGVLVGWGVFFVVWYLASLAKGGSIGALLMSLRHRFPEGVSERSPRLLARFAFLWIPILAASAIILEPSLTGQHRDEALFWGVLVPLFWYLALLVSLLSSRRSVALHDHISQTYVEPSSELPVCWWLRVVTILLASAPLVINLGVFSYKFKTKSLIEPLVGAKSFQQDGNKVYKANEVMQLHKQRVMEIGTLKGCGSGFLFANDGKHGLVFTNWHVLDNQYNTLRLDKCQLRRVDAESPIEGKIVARGVNGMDLGLILVEMGPSWDSHAVSYAAADKLQQGEDAVAIGNTLGAGISVTNGLISKIDKDPATGVAMIRTNAPISPGNSGGPLFINRGAMLVGIITCFRVDAQNFNLAISAELAYKTASWKILTRSSDEAGIIRKLLGGNAPAREEGI